MTDQPGTTGPTYEDVGDFLIYLTADLDHIGETEHSPKVVNITIHFPKGTFRQANNLEARTYASVNLSPEYARLLSNQLLALVIDAEAKTEQP